MNFWQDVLLIVEKHTSPQCFDTWFRPIVYRGTDNGVLRLVVPTESFKRCLIENYSRLLLDSAVEIAEFSLVLDISVEARSSSESPPAANAAVEKQVSSPVLIPKYTFDSFVVGASNQLAHAAATAVAERPSKAYTL